MYLLASNVPPPPSATALAEPDLLVLLISVLAKLIISYSDILIGVIMTLLVLLTPSLRRFFFASHPHTSGVKHDLPSGRSAQIDAIRGVSILAVMGVHAVYFPAVSPGLPLPDWTSATLINNLLRFGVPVFLMLSGYCLEPWSNLSTRSSRLEFFTRKFKRIIIPYVIVSVAVLWLSPGFSWRDLPHALLYGTASPPFYFVVVLAQLYLIYPLLCFLSTRPIILLSASLIISIVFSFPQMWRDVLAFPIFAPYLFPFVFGMLSRNLKLSLTLPKNVKVTPAIITSLFFVSVNAIFAVLVIWQGNSSSASGFYSYNFQFFYAASVLTILAICLNTTPSRLTSYLAPLGKYSLWIYLLHYPLQHYIWKLIEPPTETLALQTALLLWTSSALLATLLCHCFNCLAKRRHHYPGT
jgi:peptidoglycan/LPS O-acetylase OafA/YrhL